MAVVGIDLGTTNAVVACVRNGQVQVLADDEGSRLLPSVVGFHPNGDILVGREAKSRRFLDPPNTIFSVKRLIGRPWDSDEMRLARSRFGFELREGPGQGALVVVRGETYTLPEISAFVLKRVRQIAEAALNETVDKAVITVPAHFNELQRASTKIAARVAGLEVLRILNEPTAAAMAYGFASDRSERVAVYDFGGGTFDCSLVELTGSLYEVLATSGDTFLGGDDIDTAIAEVMCSAYVAQHRFDPRADSMAFERLRAAAEGLKKELTRHDEAQVRIDDVAFGANGRGLRFTFGMTRGDLDAVAAPFVERSLNVTRDALNVAGIPASSFDRIVLVGGSTRMPVVRRAVEAFFGIPVTGRLNPDEVVAIGAAVQAAALVDHSRTRSIPAAPIPGILGRPQRVDGAEGDPTRAPSSVLPPDASALRPPVAGRAWRATADTSAPVLKTMRPPSNAAAVPPPAAPLAANATVATLNQTGGERSIVTQSRGILERDDERAEDSLGTSQTLPRGEAGDAEDEPLSTTDIRVAAPPSYMRKLQRARTRPMEESPTAIAPAPKSRAPGASWGGMNPLDTEDISLIVLQAVPPSPGPSRGPGSGLGPGDERTPLSAEPPSNPASHSISPRGVNVGPLATEDISIIAPEGPRAPFFPSDLPVLPASPEPSAFPSRARPSALPARASVVPARPSALPPSPAPPAPPPPPNPLAGPAGPPRPPSILPEGQGEAPYPYNGPAAPVLVDVTPRALVVETVGGYCDTVIPRNATIPCEHTRVFATGRDLQTLVHVRVAQGEKGMFAANQYLGEVEVSNLRPATRGEVLLSVTFELDSDGSLVVRASDLSTGREAKAAMKLITVTQSEDEIEEMIERSRSVSVKARTS
jgi:molecular chaperone DnaK